MSTNQTNSMAVSKVLAAQELERLIAAVGGGCRASFATVYEQTHRKLFGIVLRLVRQRSDAEDILQEVYVKVWSRSSQFDASRGQAIFWLASIAHRAAIDELRKRARRPSIAGPFADEDADGDVFEAFATDDAGPLDRYEAAQRAAAVQARLLRLSDEQRESLVLAFFDGLTHPEIAARLSCPLGTVKARVRRGLQALAAPGIQPGLA